jgi:transcriptional regulator with XRE-family HTH domain
MATDKEVLEYVKALMRERGFKPSDLAKRLNTGRATVSNWWNRLGKIPDDWFKPLAQVFEVHEEDIRTAGAGVMIIRHAGDRIRFMRKANGLSAEHVADTIGMKLEDYLAVEMEGHLPPTSEFLALVRLLGAKNPHWLAHGDPVVRSPPGPDGGNDRKQNPMEPGPR